MSAAFGSLQMPKLDGHEIAPRVYLIGEPMPVVGTDRFRCLADFYGAMAVIELSIKFATPPSASTPSPDHQGHDTERSDEEASRSRSGDRE